MAVPFLDLKLQYALHKKEIDDAIQRVIENQSFIGGPILGEFEKHLAELNQSRHAIGVSSGTSALFLALKTLGIGPGDEVITVPMTFIATVEAILNLGADVRFVDIDKRTFTIDPQQLETAITKRTKAIVPVHLYGQMADMLQLRQLADRHGLYLVEDAAQAHGATHHGKSPGFYGDMATFSFYPGKNIGAYGDAGAVITNNDQWAESIRKLRDHGRLEKYSHDVIGDNFRMDTLQASILCCKYNYLEIWNQRRIEIARLYSDALESMARTRGVDIQLPFIAQENKAVFHIYPILLDGRDRIAQNLKLKGIATGVHYPIPLHLQPALKHLPTSQNRYPQTEFVASRELSLPIFPEMTDHQVEQVISGIGELFVD